MVTHAPDVTDSFVLTATCDGESGEPTASAKKWRPREVKEGVEVTQPEVAKKGFLAGRQIPDSC